MSKLGAVARVHVLMCPGVTGSTACNFRIVLMYLFQSTISNRKQLLSFKIKTDILWSRHFKMKHELSGGLLSVADSWSSNCKALPHRPLSLPGLLYSNLNSHSTFIVLAPSHTFPCLGFLSSLPTTTAFSQYSHTQKSSLHILFSVLKTVLSLLP